MPDGSWRRLRWLGLLPVLVTASLFLSARMARTPDDLGLRDGRLAGCPDSPNCVSTTATDARHSIEPLAIEGDPEAAWQTVREAVQALPRTEIVTEQPDYLHAEVRSLVFRFVDDLEVHLDRAAGKIHFRSASRTGYSDFGVNRKRVESLRSVVRAHLAG